ncbi:aldose epimerase family protein [Streptobacillus moniliformis]|uniref:Aldose 1-epimerase n=1 Tax=Streptobacillus moniliformis (strain ATCC 14647 / DSM 12112 / NCTC 10651 / 9901) TaxID=519441 RepID=D1AWX9_STRM9|nr:aldose epimerase family protein [Streptobacillus moniliformis]ACZ00805.1 Aldose 1-epimerase [Streptobacillus moniliformis DSM 12112]AVL42799.1 galactose mutarotase [Streptobacillus moniliformis]QXW65556.1 galactose mutarotase [Streptobacillus moniliformis]SQA14060.1 Aldose 1-epimerase precursor [Streptobacillus moniliformis]
MINYSKNILGKLGNKEVTEHILKNSNGFEVHILNLGGIITKILVEDKDGVFRNVVLGYDFFEKYLNDPSYAGSIIGPTSGRIENGKYSIDGIEYVLEINSGEHANHGGTNSLTSKIFDVKPVVFNEYKGIELKYFWKHLDGNHHGNMTFYIRYMISEKSELLVELHAESDRNSYINLTNHSYFNLSGDLRVNGDEQLLKISANEFCPVKENMIPTGEKLKVDNTCFDLREYVKIKDGINVSHPQFDITRAYDHAFVLDKDKEVAVSLYSEYSGIKLNVETSQNCMVVYTGNFLDDAKAFGNLKENSRYLGVALEAQNYQNGINIENFDSKLTKPTMPYFEKIKYIFETVK